MRRIIVGSRGSQLARAQALQIIAALRAAHGDLQLEHRIVVTSGDRDRASALRDFGGKGAFTKELEELLLGGSIDLAVHSLKDLPTAFPAGLGLGATPPREEVRDALCGASLEQLSRGARVGTGSPRRGAQILRVRADLRIAPLRGNVPTRLAQLEGERDLEAIVLAAAGLRRLGLGGHIAELLPLEICPPAPAQGALGLEIRRDDRDLESILAPLDDPISAACVQAERALLQELGGGCSIPLGACARPTGGGHLELIAQVTALDGSAAAQVHLEGRPEEPAQLGRAGARQLLEHGAGELLAAAREAQDDGPGPGF